MCATNLIETMRGELQQQGEVLALFDDIEAQATPRTLDEALTRLTALREQERIVELTLCTRERVQRQLACRLGLPETADLNDILPMLPPQDQILIQALSEENLESSTRAHHRANHLHQLIRRSLDLLESSFGECAIPPVPLSQNLGGGRLVPRKDHAPCTLSVPFEA